MPSPLRRLAWSAAVVTFGSAVVSILWRNWLLSRFDDQITERTPFMTAYLVQLARWGIANPFGWIFGVLITGLLLIGLLLFVQRVSKASVVSIDGVDYYWISHVAVGRTFIIATDVTITNRSQDKTASIGVEYVYEESMSYTSEKGATETYRHTARAKPENDPVLLWDKSDYFKRNKPLVFPLNLDPRETVGGYIAFAVSTGSPEVSSSAASGLVVFTDYHTRAVVHERRMTRHFFIGPLGLPS